LTSAIRVTAPPAVGRLDDRRQRDLRLDFFRGAALFCIFIDHIPGNLLTWATLHNIAFCDAAEVFIFISGFAAAMVYGRALTQRGVLFATAQIYRRVWQLYVAHVFIFVVFIAEVSYTVSAVNNPIYNDELRVGDFLEQPHIAILQALLLRFQPNFLNILPLYIVLLGIFPAILIGLRRHRRLVLAASLLLYGVSVGRGWTVPGYPDGETWFFNPLAWQLLFVIGALCGHSAAEGRPLLPQTPWLPRLATTVVLVAALISLSWGLHEAYEPIPALLLKSLWRFTIDKSNLAPLRLVNFLALAIAVIRVVPRHARFLRWRLVYPVILCGQHSLHVFCLSILLSVTGHFILGEFWPGLAGQLLVNLSGVALMIATAAVLGWYKNATASTRFIDPAPAPSGDP